MRSCQGFCAIVIGMQYIVSSATSLTATHTVMQLTNVTVILYEEQVALTCGRNSTDNQTETVTFSRIIKTETESIARWTRTVQKKAVPEGRDWTVTFDNNTGDIELVIHDFNNADSGIYSCIVTHNKTSEKTWMNLTRSIRFETEDTTAHHGLIGSVPSKIGFSLGIFGIVAIFSGMLIAYFKKRDCIPKLASGRNQKTSQEELTSTETISFMHSLIFECIRVVESKGISTEGIYRISSPQWELIKARQDIQKDITAVCSLPVLTVSNVLKMVIRELSPPLIKEDTVKELLGVNALNTESEKCTRIKYVLQQLDSSSLDCLRAIIRHLYRVAENAAINKMDAENLAVVFAPSLLQTALSYNHLEPIDAIKAANEETQLKCKVISMLIQSL